MTIGNAIYVTAEGNVSNKAPPAAAPIIGNGLPVTAPGAAATAGTGDQSQDAPARPQGLAGVLQDDSLDPNVRKLFRKKVELKMDWLPTAATKATWKAELYAKLAAEAQRNDPGLFDWVDAVEDVAASVDSVREVPKEFFDLDTSLAAMIQGLAKGDLKTRLANKNSEELTSHNKVLGGRQCLFIVFRLIRINPNSSERITIMDLHRLPPPGPKGLWKFMADWEHLLTLMGAVPTEPQLLMIL